MIKKIFLKIIRFYQLFISPSLGNHCRFLPSCSEYTRQSIQKYGTVKGSYRGFRRILKCHPYHPGGVDLP